MLPAMLLTPPDGAGLIAEPATERRHIRLLALDLDGTLLGPDRKVARETAAALRRLHDQGDVHVVLATARPPRGVRAIYRELGLGSLSIHYNGVLIWDAPSRRSLFHRPMSGELTLEMVRLARQLRPEVEVQMEIHDKSYTDRGEARFTTETGRLFQFDGVLPVEEICRSAVTKLMFLGGPETLVPIEIALQRDFAPKASILYTDRDLIQIMDRRGGKASAVQKVARHLNVPRRQVMAVGDNLNDYGMLRWAGIGVAMGNARPVLKNIADWVAPTNAEQGVLAALEKYGLTEVMS
jgi:Cof subfamily protein (haloacid dehalogenase superfamily)